MEKRARSIQIKFRVSEEEYTLLMERMARSGIGSKERFLRKMALNGYILRVNYDDLKQNTAALGRIGGNINQIVKRMNQTGRLYRQDVDEVKELMKEVWRLQRSSLLKAR